MCYMKVALSVIPSTVDVLRAGYSIKTKQREAVIEDLVDIQASDGVYIGGPLC
jgi:hypothetical protein